MVCEEVSKQRGEVGGVGVVFLWRACLIETARCGDSAGWLAPKKSHPSGEERKKNTKLPLAPL